MSLQHRGRRIGLALGRSVLVHDRYNLDIRGAGFKIVFEACNPLLDVERRRDRGDADLAFAVERLFRQFTRLSPKREVVGANERISRGGFLALAVAVQGGDALGASLGEHGVSRFVVDGGAH